MADHVDTTGIADIHFTEGLAAAADLLRGKAQIFRAAMMVALLGPDTSKLLGDVFDAAAAEVMKADRP